jgi:hypothetical protein
VGLLHSARVCVQNFLMCMSPGHRLAYPLSLFSYIAYLKMTALPRARAL